MERCSACPNKKKCIPASGPDECDFLFIGEAPGYDEERQGEVLVGKVGLEFDKHFLPLAGLRRPNVKVTNTIKCFPDRADGKISMSESKDKELAKVCGNHFLNAEILMTDPKFIIPMGPFANYLIGDGKINLDMHHGIPSWSMFGDIFPMYNPSAGLADSKKLFMIRQDFIRLKRYRTGTLKVWTDEYPIRDYQEVTDVREINELDPTGLIAGDTEFTPDYDPYVLTYSVEPGTGRLIRASRKDLLKAFNKKIQTWENYILFHNWMADRPICEKMGIYMPDNRMRDTMVRMSIIGGMLKGLKPFGFRELGVKMNDFEDMTKPHSIPRILEYFKRIQDHDWPKPEESMYQDKTGLWKIKKPQSMNTKIKRFFTDYSRNPDKDVLEMWENWKDEAESIEAVCGRYTGLDVRDVPWDILLPYACTDADITLRTWPILEEMMDNMTSKSPEYWRKM